MNDSKLLEPYGLDFRKFSSLPNQLEIELLYIAIDKPENFGGLDREEHIKHVIQILYPWVWKNWHEWNDLMLWAWCNYDEIGMTGCAAAHKTFTFSLLSFIEWLAKPTATSVVLTSTTIPSLRGRIWSEICKFYNSATIPFNYNVVDSREKIQSVKGDDKFSIRAIAVDSGDVEKSVGKIQGVHPERMILCIDEAAQTPPAIYTARANLRVGTTFYRCVAIANASDPFDAHGRFCEPKGGWSTISADSETWETKSGICLHFDGLKSPNVKLGKARYPRLFSQTEIDNTRKDFGENSLEWWSYVRGFWAPRGVRNTVLDASMIFDGKADQPAIWEGSGTVNYASLDPAFTTEGDACILRFGKVGNFLDGKPGIELTDIIKIQLIESTEYPINFQIADRVILECKDRNVSSKNFGMDVTSASGLADILIMKGFYGFNKVCFGGSPIEGPVSPWDDREASDVYKNRVTQLWYSVNHLVAAGRIRGMESETSREFCTRQYDLKNQITCVESKKDMKKRTGGASPDRADAATIIVDTFLQNYNLVDLQKSSNVVQTDWNQIITKFKLAENYRN